MTTNTEALREQFELYVNPEGDIKLHRAARTNISAPVLRVHRLRSSPVRHKTRSNE